MTAHGDRREPVRESFEHDVEPQFLRRRQVDRFGREPAHADPLGAQPVSSRLRGAKRIRAEGVRERADDG